MGGLTPTPQKQAPQVQPVQQEASFMDSIIPKANASEDVIVKFYNDSSISDDKKEMFSKAIDDGMPRSEAEQYLSKEFYGEAPKTEAPKEEAGFGDYLKGFA